MRVWLFFSSVLLACNNPRPPPWTNEDAGVPPEAAPIPIIDAAPSCVGLACQQIKCGTTTTTSVSGTVFDPAGSVPLGDALVYVPNAPLEPIGNGTVATACEAPLSGNPLVTTQTSADGTFILTDMPVGKNIPIVVQLGKFRRTIKVLQVKECVDNPIGIKDVNNRETLTRLPRMQSEGDLPRIAVTSGCDPLECLLWKLGLDTSEFTSDGTSTAHVVLHQGGLAAPKPFPTSPTAASLFGSTSTLSKFDAVIAACQCSPTDVPFTAVQTYTDAGGRFFATHEHHAIFDAPGRFFDDVGFYAWAPPVAATAPPFFIDTSTPRGSGFGLWSQAVQNPKPKVGEISMESVGAASIGPVTLPAQRWIYSGSTTDATKANATVATFNVPLNKPLATQFGRVVVADAHSNTQGSAQDFPTQCGAQNAPLTDTEQMLEYFFFYLFSCIQDDGAKTIVPPRQ